MADYELPAGGACFGCAPRVVRRPVAQPQLGLIEELVTGGLQKNDIEKVIAEQTDAATAKAAVGFGTLVLSSFLGKIIASAFLVFIFKKQLKLV